MKTEKTFYKVSIQETFLLMGFMLILFNGLIFTFTLVTGNPRLLIYDTSWILQFVFPILHSIIWTSINRNGFLKISEFNDSTQMIARIETLMPKRHIRFDSDTGNIEYLKKTKLARFFNNFFRENIKIENTKEEIVIFAKKNILNSIELKIKHDRTN
ncbi:MAG: hypothetical protein RBT49_17710 [Bacteroidales bacterium]|jgi:hypothetical protein|nr:hypothetical protein [Bacteroidales bacterium]